VAARQEALVKSLSARTPYQGVIQIVQFNRRFYVAAILGVATAVVASRFLPHPLRLIVLVCALPPLFWLASSLIVSHLVYDRSHLYDFNWLDRIVPLAPQSWINIHSGFDETSELLAAKFPGSQSRAVDIYDPDVMTEPSIAAARHLASSPVQAIAAHHDALPFAAESINTAFLIFSAHELRRHAQRVTFFTEVARLLTPGGSIILVEHSRDLWNFLAFGPGVFHFFSKKTWRRAAFDASLTVHAASSITPFVCVYNLRRAA
jgi:hypothetical protein